MVLRYEKFNESIKEISFIPFELRQNIDINFIWNEETEKIAYHHYTENIGYLPHSIEYLKEMKKRLMGKNISFYAYNYKTHEVCKHHGIVGKIGYNINNVLALILVNEMGYPINSKGAIDERKPVTYYEQERRHDEIDPYGEDDW